VVVVCGRGRIRARVVDTLVERVGMDEDIMFVWDND